MALKSPQEMFQAMKANIEAKTGKALPAWVALAKASGIETFKALVDHMKSEHGISHGYAQMVAWAVLDPARLDATHKDQSMVDDLYSGARESLRPLYDRLVAEGMKLGSDVELVICKTYSSLRSKSQFAVVVPRTKSAVDLELCLSADTPAEGRLESIKNSNPRITHRIRIGSEAEVDGEVVTMIEKAWRHNTGG